MQVNTNLFFSLTVLSPEINTFKKVLKEKKDLPAFSQGHSKFHRQFPSASIVG